MEEWHLRGGFVKELGPPVGFLSSVQAGEALASCRGDTHSGHGGSSPTVNQLARKLG